MQKKYCMLEDNKICDDCCECNICDIDKKKICDNCAKCIDSDNPYKVIIDEIILEDDLKKKLLMLDSWRINKH